MLYCYIKKIEKTTKNKISFISYNDLWYDCESWWAGIANKDLKVVSLSFKIIIIMIMILELLED